MEGLSYIRCAKDGDQNPVIKEFVSIFDNHMGAANEIKIVGSKKVGDDLLPKAVTNAPLIRLPVGFHIGGVRPKEIVE